MAISLPRLLRTSPKLSFICAVLAGTTLTSTAWSLYRKPRVWSPQEVPIAFWAWRTEAPTETDLLDVTQKAQAQTLFLRAGQIDLQDGTLRRIRPVQGAIPSGIQLHLVYNATRSLLTKLENVDENDFASIISETFAADVARARADNTSVSGLQIDIDVPTRLLSQYAKTLRLLRSRLATGQQLSITGLPTWMESAALTDVLNQVDFWIPQCYGSQIPERLEQLIPISSPQFVSRAVARARELDRPFFAGLAAYSYTLLYSSNGALITLRGDMDPFRIATDANLELVERRAFENTSEWRYVYRARSAGVTEGLAMNAGDFLVIDAPSTESLRVAARVVRESGGKKLRGICVFRLPGDKDAATLKIDQVAAALRDVPPRADVSVMIEARRPNQELRPDVLNEARVTVMNNGTEGILAGEGLIVDLALPLGIAQPVSVQGFFSVTPQCSPAPSDSTVAAVPCSERRANVLRFKAATLAPGETAEARFLLNAPIPSVLFAQVELQADDGQTHRFNRQVIVSSGARK